MIVSGKAKLAGVIGWPVAHSLSPRLHGHWLETLEIDGAYVPLPVHPEDLAAVLGALPRMGFAGVNLTLPHKRAALALLDEVTPEARRIGAVNTVVFGAEGRSRGSNTDAFGFIASLRQECPGFSAARGPAVMLGAGGAARAVAAALVDDGAPELRVVARSTERAEALAHDIGGPIAVHPWAEAAAALADAAVLVNTTTLGMEGQPPLALDLAALPVEALVTDVVYVPRLTDLLVRARARGNHVVGGLGMLLHQARPGFAAWFGVDPPVTPALRQFLEGT